MPFYAQDIKAARDHLRKNDPVMKAIIRDVGPFTVKARRDRFSTLVFSILSQQISTAAAKTIRGRLLAAVDNKVTAEKMVKFDVDKLRELGISRQKVGYILDLADKVHSKSLDLSKLHRSDDETAIESLVQVKGIGRWTAQMFLMFSLARLDVLPVDDLGIKNAMVASYNLKDPTKEAMTSLAQKWQPYRTIACWYLWQSLSVSPE